MSARFFCLLSLKCRAKNLCLVPHEIEAAKKVARNVQAWRSADSSIPSARTVVDFYLKFKINFLFIRKRQARTKSSLKFCCRLFQRQARILPNRLLYAHLNEFVNVVSNRNNFCLPGQRDESART